ncbi:MAG: lipid-A-disaccharide synthase N-terminal domain-containing protein [Planctomycetes bacterium]|nr:lipid-A-disaccharide synthase N-terminal domain-containing protein [Planctomycetota bacterium]MCC7396392.1 lipid-A-disaccharide synthase N-terminal domain-containing protein [Planctomycetota bacterium]
MLVATTATAAAISSTPWYWWVIGFGGQIVFASRFWVQWLASERAKRSVMPISFWYLSLIGGLLSLSYAVYRWDPVFVLGQVTGTFIYARNLALIRQAQKDGVG